MKTVLPELSQWSIFRLCVLDRLSLEENLKNDDKMENTEERLRSTTLTRVATMYHMNIGTKEVHKCLPDDNTYSIYYYCI